MTEKRQDWLANRGCVRVFVAMLGLQAAALAQSYTLNGQFTGPMVDYYSTFSNFLIGDTHYCVQTAATFANGASAGTTILNRNDGAGNVTISGKVLCLTNDAVYGYANSGNVLMYSINKLDMATPGNISTTLVNAFSTYGVAVAFNNPAGWFGKGGSAETSGNSTWKTDPPFPVPGGWVCMPIFRQDNSQFYAHDLTLSCSPDGGSHWCNPYTYYHRAGGAGCDATNWDASGDAPLCAAAGGVATGACTDAAYTDATHSSMMWHEPAPYNYTTGAMQEMYFFTFQQGNDGTLPFGNYLYGYGSTGGRRKNVLFRVPNNIGAVLDASQYTWYTQANYSPTNVGDGTTWTSTQTNATILWDAPSTDSTVPLINPGPPRGTPWRVCAGTACTLMFQGVWGDATGFNPLLVTMPAPWGPFTVTSKQPLSASNVTQKSFWNVMPWTATTVDSAPFRVRAVSMWDSTGHAGPGSPYWQNYELTLAAPQLGAALFGNGGARFTMGPSANSLSRNGLQYFFDFYDHAGDTTAGVSATFDQARVLNGAYQSLQTAALTPCFTAGTIGCGFSNSGTGLASNGGAVNAYPNSRGWVLRNLTGGAGADIAPAMFAGDKPWTISMIFRFNSVGALTQNLLSVGNSAAPSSLIMSQYNGQLFILWYNNNQSINWYVLSSGPIFSTGAWSMLTITKSPGIPTTSNTTIYLNGVKVSSVYGTNGTPTGFSLGAGPVTLGVAATDPNRGMTGTFANTTIYNRPLSATEVLRMYKVMKPQLARRGVSLP